jgi:AraC-like DNA-binding protein
VARIDAHNKTRYWCDPAFPGLSLLHADFTTHEYAPHSHDAFVVAVTEAGGSEFKSRGQTHEAHQERLLVFNPAEPHSGRMARSRRWRYRSLYLSAPALHDLQAALGIAFAPYFLSNVFNDRDLIASFHALHRALDEGEDLPRAREILVSSFGELFRRHGSHGERIPAAPRDRTILDLIIADMHERQAESLTLEMLGEPVGLTPFQLIGLFKRGTGLTPHTYLTQMRLRSAIRHLGAGEPIAAAAIAAGFYDQSALTFHFKRAYGITPLQYVRAHSQQDTPRNFDQ